MPALASASSSFKDQQTPNARADRPRSSAALSASSLSLAKAREDALKAAEDSGLSARAFGICWSLKDDEALAKAGISGVELAKEAETLLTRFPNAQVNDDEQRRLRAALYRPL